MEQMKERVKNTVTINGKRYVCRIFDNGGQSVEGGTLDRYTIALKGKRDLAGRIFYPYLAASENPFHSFGQHGESRYFLVGKYLGRRVSFDSLPHDVKRFITDNLGKG
jgi:hypothetical protein